MSVVSAVSVVCHQKYMSVRLTDKISASSVSISLKSNSADIENRGNPFVLRSILAHFVQRLQCISYKVRLIAECECFVFIVYRQEIISKVKIPMK